MTVPWEMARDEWAKRKIIESAHQRREWGIPDVVDRVGTFQTNRPAYVPTPDEITIVDIDIDGGGDVQIGDMTWDHDDPTIEITYKITNVAGPVRDGCHTENIELNFHVLVREIVAVAEDIRTALD